MEGRGQQRRPGTHPIQAAQVLHPVLVPVLVIVDDGVLLVHAAGLGDTDNFQVAFPVGQDPGDRGPHHPNNTIITTGAPITTIPTPAHRPQSPGSPAHILTPQVCAPWKAHPGLTRPPGHTTGVCQDARQVPLTHCCHPGPSLCDQPFTANKPEPPFPPKLVAAPGSAVGGAGNPLVIWDMMFSPKARWGRAGWPERRGRVKEVGDQGEVPPPS